MIICENCANEMISDDEGYWKCPICYAEHSENTKDESINLIISKVDFKLLLEGKLKQIRFYKESELHYEFGDYPDQYIMKIHISPCVDVTTK